MRDQRKYLTDDNTAKALLCCFQVSEVSNTNGKLSMKSYHDKVNLLERKMRVKRWPAYVSLVSWIRLFGQLF